MLVDGVDAARPAGAIKTTRCDGGPKTALEEDRYMSGSDKLSKEQLAELKGYAEASYREFVLQPAQAMALIAMAEHALAADCMIQPSAAFPKAGGSLCSVQECLPTEKTFPRADTRVGRPLARRAMSAVSH